jgi:hypothetical protein
MNLNRTTTIAAAAAAAAAAAHECNSLKLHIPYKQMRGYKI